MNKKFRMGIIGCGGISGSHIGGIMASPDLEVVALCDILPEKIKEKQLLCGVADGDGVPDDNCYSNYIEMLDSGKIDAVSICTPNYLHFQMAMEAVKRGIPYAIEKPVCNTAEEAAILLEETKKKNIPHMVCFSYRFIAAARYARDLVQSGALGNIYHINGEYFQGWGLPNPKTGAVGSLVWRFIKEQTITGALGDLGCHLIDLVRFITGREFTRITADCDTFIHKRPIPGENIMGDVTVDDYIDIVGQLEGPVATNLSISRYAYSRGNYQRVEIYGDNGAIRYTLEDRDQLEINIGNEPMKNAHLWCAVPTPHKYHSAQMQSFADILNGRGDGLAANMEDGWKTQKVIDAAVIAANNVVKL
ncbi:MAG: Gfo/Idh/MocA family oxidoreductase [Oscillospiraceae bacterium]|nr:Gfo/Idh/MocA family oxidoreductase [Oscillospiraceae bacterium]